MGPAQKHWFTVDIEDNEGFRQDLRPKLHKKFHPPADEKARLFIVPVNPNPFL